MSDKILNEQLDLSDLPAARVARMSLLAYLPFFGNTVQGFPGVRNLLLILLNHAAPPIAFRWVMEREEQLHRLFRWLSRRGWF